MTELQAVPDAYVPVMKIEVRVRYILDGTSLTGVSVMVCGWG